MNIGVFLSAADLDERYTRPAREFAELIGKGGHTLVWGGSDTGLMKVVADGVRETGGRLVGISVGISPGLGQEGRRRDGDRQGSRQTEGADARPIGRDSGDGRRPGHAGRGDRDPGAEEARTARQAGGAAEHGGLLRRVDTPAPADGGRTGSCRCPWPSWSSSPTRVPAHSPTWRSPSECSATATKPEVEKHGIQYP